MAGQYELSDKHLNCIKRTQDMISAVEEISARNDKNPKEKIKQYLSRSFGLLPSESEIYNDYLGMVVSLEEIARKNRHLALRFYSARWITGARYAHKATSTLAPTFPTCALYTNLLDSGSFIVFKRRGESTRSYVLW